MQPIILFIMHMPPPVHGAAMMGQYIHDSKLVNDSFECRFINLAVAKELKDVGRFRIGKAFDYLRLLKKIREEVRCFRPDLVYVTPNTVGAPFYKDLLITQLVKSMGCKVVAHFHNKGVSTRQDRWLDDKLYRLAFRNQKSILLSERLFSDIQKYALREDVLIVPNGIPSGELSIECKPQGGQFTILFLSNMIASKGVWTLLESLRILKSRNVRFHCEFVGGWKDVTEGEFRDRLFTYHLESCVRCLGPRYGQDKTDSLRRVDVLAFPTEYPGECFPLVLLEAMQQSCACIGTDEGGIPDIIDDGETGFIVPKGDPVAFADALQKLAEDRGLCAEMGRRGQRKFQEKFTLEVFERNIVDCLKNIIEEGNQPEGN